MWFIIQWRLADCSSAIFVLQLSCTSVTCIRFSEFNYLVQWQSLLSTELSFPYSFVSGNRRIVVNEDKPRGRNVVSVSKNWGEVSVSFHSKSQTPRYRALTSRVQATSRYFFQVVFHIPQWRIVSNCDWSHPELYLDPKLSRQHQELYNC